MVLLNIAEGTSRLHASRRVFEVLEKLQIDVPVIHHKRCGACPQLAPPHSIIVYRIICHSSISGMYERGGGIIVACMYL